MEMMLREMPDEKSIVYEDMPALRPIFCLIMADFSLLKILQHSWAVALISLSLTPMIGYFKVKQLG